MSLPQVDVTKASHYENELLRHKHVSEFGHVRYHAAYIKAFCVPNNEMCRKVFRAVDWSFQQS